MGVSGRMPSFSGPPAFVCVHLAGPAVEAFRLRDVSWNRASSPVTNPAGVYVLRIAHKRLACLRLLRSAAVRFAKGMSFVEGVEEDCVRGGQDWPRSARRACSREWRSG